MTYPRAHLVDSDTPCFYHVVSRCVRRAWLCGNDPLTGRSYEHRRAWVEQRLLFLARYFSVEVYAYAVMNNHYHIVLYFDPLAPSSWDDDEVARRWLALNPRRGRATETALDAEQQIKLLAADAHQIQTYRRRLASLSWYMRYLNHPVACRANREDACTGHFWEGRFRSTVLLDESAVLACMAYVDLNPVRAKIARQLDECDHTSIKLRLKEWRSDAPLASLGSSNAEAGPRLSLTHDQYCALLRSVGSTADIVSPDLMLWLDRVASMRFRQRAYGSRERLRQWVQHIGQRWTKALALPL
jgi:putative transposase